MLAAITKTDSANPERVGIFIVSADALADHSTHPNDDGPVTHFFWSATFRIRRVQVRALEG